MKKLKNTSKLILIAAIFFILGATVSYNLKKPQPNLPINNQTSRISSHLIDKYFPIQKGDYWVYEGVKKEELEGGGIEVNMVQKRVEVLDIQETENGKLIVLRGSEPTEYLIKDNTIDFNPDLPLEARFIWTFPLYVGQKFGIEDDLRYRDDGFYIKLVEEKLSKEVLGKKYEECFKITYKGVPDSSYKVFVMV